MLQQIDSSHWLVLLNNGKIFGSYHNLNKAKQRSEQIDKFQAMDSQLPYFLNNTKTSSIFKQASTIKNKPTYSSTLRDLRKNKPEEVNSFLFCFQQSFYQAINQNLENPENLALLQTLSIIKHQ